LRTKNVKQRNKSVGQSPFEKLMVAQVVKKAPSFHGIGKSLVCSQESVTNTYPQPDVFIPHFPTLFL